MDKLKEVLKTFANFSNDDLNIVISHFKELTIKQGEFITKANENVKYLYFVNNGFFEHYLYKQNGDKIIAAFSSSNFFSGDLSSFINQNPCIQFVESITDSHVFRISISDYLKLIRQMRHFETFSRKLAETLFEMAQKRIYELLIYTHEELYLQLLNNNPDLFKYASMQSVASFLGITKESLSRIRKRIN